MKNLAIIPARGGSKRIPNKNLRLLGARPLLEHTIDHALASVDISAVVVSSDSPEILDLAFRRGVLVHQRRPELATDEAKTDWVIEDVLRWIKTNEIGWPDNIILLQPTSPFRAYGLIDTCIRVMVAGGYDSLHTVVERGHFHWYQSGTGRWCTTDERRLMSQDPLRKRIFAEAGTVFVVRAEYFAEHKERVALRSRKIGVVEVDALDGLDIDTEFDFWMAEKILAERDKFRAPLAEAEHAAEVK